VQHQYLSVYRIPNVLVIVHPALSQCRSGASNYGRGMTQSLPLFYWSPEKSYMTSSHTATNIYISARFRVKDILSTDTTLAPYQFYPDCLFQCKCTSRGMYVESVFMFMNMFIFLFLFILMFMIILHGQLH
jgi:hypothetical protein